jgi:hypothetical protein
MTRDKLQFRHDLLEAEPIDPLRRAKFEREVNAMWEQRLTLARLVWLKVLAMSMLVLGVGFGATAYLAPGSLPPVARIGFGIGCVFCLTFLFILIMIGRRGTMNLRVDPMRIAGLGWGFVVSMMVIFMMLASAMKDSSRGVLMVVNGIVFLIGAGLILLRTVIEQSERRTRERLLQIEYRLEQLSDDLKKRDGGDDQFDGVRV